MNKTRLSVAMCTYNGARFLTEQLESIAAQTRLPDELVVCDDGSKDETLAILRAFAGRAPFAVRLEVNDKNLGSTKNFEKAIGLCDGGIIALADQDDIWKPPKLAVLERILLNDPQAGYAFSDAELIDASGKLTGRGLWGSIRLHSKQVDRFQAANQFAILLRRTVVTGATMVFRAALRKILLPISSQFVQDYWISLLASGVGAYGMPLREPLIQYRQHGGQQIGIGSRSLVEKVRTARQLGASQYSGTVRGYLDVRERLVASANGWSFTADHMQLLEKKIKHCAERSIAHSTHGTMRFRKVFGEVLTGRYGHFSDSWRSILRDLCF